MACFVVQATSARALSVPPLQGRINDPLHVLSPHNVEALEKILAQHEEITSNQVAVLIIPSLEDDNLESFSHRVASAWALGQNQKDNGVLLLIVLYDRLMRIEVGYGLESKLTDVLAGHIIQNEIAPEFRKENYNQGVINGVQSIVSVLQNTYDQTSVSRLGLRHLSALFFVIFIYLGIALLGCLGAILLKRHFSAFLIYLFFAGFWLITPRSFFSDSVSRVVFLIYLALFPACRIYFRMTDKGQKHWKQIVDSLNQKKSDKNNHFYSGWGHSLRSMNSSSSSGGSFSSFSGGGGSFGGGGASGSW